MASYSKTTDLLLGDIPTPGYLDKDKIVQDAADEIDSQIGFTYTIPVDVSQSSPVIVPVRLLLKRINNFLATGRLIMQVASNGEDKQLHAYGISLVEQANAAISMIVSGEIDLIGAVKRPGTETQTRGPKIVNGDPESYVDAFYDRIANPGYIYPPHWTIPTYGALPRGLVT